MSTIFISHSSADNALALELLGWLKIQGYSSNFLDLDLDEGIKPGEHWEKVLNHELISCSVVIAIVTDHWLTSKWCFAEAAHARSNGKTLLGLSVNLSTQATILADKQLIDYSPDNRTDAYLRLAESLRRAIDPQGLGRWNPTRPLFPGLMFFDEQDAPIFFGRRRLGRAIYQKLLEFLPKPSGSERLLLVFGPSGSGKSSVVRAGTLPHIHANPDVWITLGPFRPTEGWPEPLRQSLDVLAGSDEQKISVKLREIANQLRCESNAPKAAILIIIDQIEEALEAKEDGAETAFWLPLSRLLGIDNTPFMALATLRSDFMGDFQKRSIKNSFRFGFFSIEPMSKDDLREVIAGPCRVAGIAIEPSLVDALVEDAGDEQALPLLALALNRLWLRYDYKHNSFTLKDYRIGLGGMRGLIDREAESTLSSMRLQENSVLEAFMCLTRQLREGILTRQPTAWDVLEPEAKKSLDPFIGARLLVRYGVDSEKPNALGAKGVVIVDLVHETLLNGWQRLHDWLERPDNRKFMSWREILRHKIVRSALAAEQKGLLLQGSELKEAKKWLKAKRLALNMQEAIYIQAAIDANKISRVKLGVAAILILTAAGGWWAWIWSDIYQMREIERAFPEKMRVASASDSDVPFQFGMEHPCKRLVRIGLTDLAVAATNQIEDSSNKDNAVRALVETLADNGQLDQAFDVANKMGYKYSKVYILQAKAKALADAGQAQQALEIVENIEDERARVKTLIDVAKTLGNIGQSQNVFKALERAEKAVGAINEGKSKADAVLDIAVAYAEIGQADRALDIANKVDNNITKAEIYQSIAKALAKSGHRQLAIQTMEDALDVVDKIENTTVKESSLGALAEGLGDLGQADVALKIAVEIVDKDTKESALKTVAKAFASEGRGDKALAIVDMIDDAKNFFDKAYALRDVAQNLARTGHADQALAVANNIKDLEIQVEAFQLVSKTLSGLGQNLQASQALKQAADAAGNIKDASKKAIALAGTGQVNQALAAAREIGKAEERANCFLAIAKNLMATDRKRAQVIQALEQALTATNEINYERTKVKSYIAVAEVFASNGENPRAAQTMEQALDIVRRMNDPLMLISVVEAMTDIGLTKQVKLGLKDSIRLGESISDEDKRSRFYSGIASIFAQLGEYRLARETADKATFATDTIIAYLGILTDYFIKKNPQLAALIINTDKGFTRQPRNSRSLFRP